MKLWPTGRSSALPGWKLTLPVAGRNGNAATLTPARLTPPWLDRDDGGALTFWAPVSGVTTPNSTHARTELISLDHFPCGAGQRVLAASVTVWRLPVAKPDVIVGQIHGADDIRSVAFVMLHYAAGAIRVVVKRERSGPAAARFPLLSGVELGVPFDYRISDNGDDTLTFTATCGSRTATATAPVPDAFRGATVRFQAGAYQLADSTAGPAADTEGALVTFSSLTAGPATP